MARVISFSAAPTCRACDVARRSNSCGKSLITLVTERKSALGLCTSVLSARACIKRDQAGVSDVSFAVFLGDIHFAGRSSVVESRRFLLRAKPCTYCFDPGVGYFSA